MCEIVKSKLGCWVAAALVFVSAISVSAADEFKAEKIKKNVPKEVPKPIAQVLSGEAVRVLKPDGKVLLELWVRKELPVAAETPSELDLTYTFRPGELIGVVRFPNGWSDFREQQVPAGVYTIRYAHQPQDGDHLGTSDYRDFLLLCRIKDDKSPEPIAEADELNDRSAAAADSTHPAIIYMVPPPKQKLQPPAVWHDEDYDYQVLVLSVRVKHKDRAVELPLAMVIVGHAIE